MRNFKVTVQYDGTHYSGWQVQVQNPSIQQKLEQSLEKILGEKTRVFGAGRTDRGVHALGQIAHFHSSSNLSTFSLQKACNSLLPKDIRITEVQEVHMQFHARKTALQRAYQYVLYRGDYCPPFIHKYVHWVRFPINMDLLRESLAFFYGEHDFSSLCSKSDPSKSKVRTIERIESYEQDQKIYIHIRAQSFLRKMVRMMIGLVLEVNRKGHASSEIKRVLELKKRESHNYHTAPAKGLFLAEVIYPPHSSSSILE